MAYEQSMTEMLGQGADNAKKYYDLDQQSKLQKLFSKNLDKKGNLSQADFYQGVQDLGLDAAHAQIAQSWYANQKKTDLDVAQSNYMLREYGQNPLAGGRNNATVGAPSQTPTIVSGADSYNAQQDPFDPTTPPVNAPPIASAPAPKDKGIAATPPTAVETPKADATGAAPRSAFDEWYAGGKVVPASALQQNPAAPAPAVPAEAPAPKQTFDEWFTAKKAESAAARGEAPASNGVPLTSLPIQAPEAEQAQPTEVSIRGDVGFQSKGAEAKLPLPPVSTAVYSTPGEDNRSAQQLVEDSYDPSKAPGAAYSGAQGGGKYFQIDQGTAPASVQTIATQLQRSGLLGSTVTPETVNAALVEAQDADYKALGPPPGPQFKDGKLDITATQNARREYMGKVGGVYKEWVGKYGKEYADQLAQKISSDNNDRATVQLNNDVEAKNAGYKGMNDFATQLTKHAVGLGSGKSPLDPLKFTNVGDMQKLNARLAAYNSIIENPKSLEDIITNAKNVAVAEGLSETEGTSRMLQLLGARGLADKLQVALASGGKIDAATLSSIGALGLLQGGGLNFKLMKHGMSLNKEVDALRTGSDIKSAQPTLSGYKQVAPVAPAQAKTIPDAPTTPPPTVDKSKDLGKFVAKIGAKMNPYPEGQTPPVGSWYMYKGHILKRGQ